MSDAVQDQQPSAGMDAPQEPQTHKHTPATVKMVQSETATLSSVICAYSGIKAVIDGKKVRPTTDSTVNGKVVNDQSTNGLLNALHSFGCGAFNTIWMNDTS